MALARCPHCGKPINLIMRAARRKFDHDGAAALIAMGATQAEVAEAYGVTKQAVSAMLKARA